VEWSSNPKVNLLIPAAVLLVDCFFKLLGLYEELTRILVQASKDGFTEL